MVHFGPHVVLSVSDYRSEWPIDEGHHRSNTLNFLGNEIGHITFPNTCKFELCFVQGSLT